MRVIAATLFAAAFFQVTPRVAPDPFHFRYERPVTLDAPSTPDAPSRACATLDADTYAHSLPALADLRVYFASRPEEGAAGLKELPYALTLSETSSSNDTAKVLNRGLRGRHLVFDLQMPERPYTLVNLDLTGENFLVTATVTGLHHLGEAGTSLGAFTLFDLASQNLSRSTTLPLPESTFPYLHVDLSYIDPLHTALDINPGMIRGATVPPSREAQTIYTSVAETTDITQRGRESVAAFVVPAHVPIERVSFEVAADGPRNFSRSAYVFAKADGDANAMREEVGGTISRVHLTDHGQQLNFEQLSIPATVGSNSQNNAHLEVIVQNGDDTPLLIRSVRLEMRQRKLCFDPPPQPVIVYYGDPTLSPPQYDYSRLFNPADPVRAATLLPERPNPLFTAVVTRRPFMERHPEVLWAALILVVLLLGLIALRSARRI